jgi:hypothetical protein
MKKGAFVRRMMLIALIDAVFIWRLWSYGKNPYETLKEVYESPEARSTFFFGANQ